MFQTPEGVGLRRRGLIAPERTSFFEHSALVCLHASASTSTRTSTSTSAGVVSELVSGGGARKAGFIAYRVYLRKLGILLESGQQPMHFDLAGLCRLHTQRE